MTTTKTALVTGATDGIGRATAAALGQRGFTVLVHGRSEAKAVAAAQALAAEAGARCEPVWGDLGELAQVRALATQVTQRAPVLDVLVNNAGVFAAQRQLTDDGHELTFQVNHLAPFLLTALLRPALEAAAQGRVVNVSSMAHANGRVDLGDLEHARGYDGYRVYAFSKLLNVHFTHELARRLAGGPVTTSALHPGVIATKLLRVGFGMGGASVANGAVTSLFCATDPSLVGVSGRYYSNGREAKPAAHAFDPTLEAELWAVSARLVGLT